METHICRHTPSNTTATQSPLPMAFNFRVAKDVLSNNDRDRLVCIYLNRVDEKLDSTVSNANGSI